MTTIQLRPTEQTIEVPPYMSFPVWLYADGTSHKELYPNIETAQNYYTMFFLIMNATCQISIAHELKNAIKVILDGKTELSISQEAYESIRSTVEDIIVPTWTDKFKDILKNIGGDKPWVKVTYNPGFEPKITFSDIFNQMEKGECKFDFIIDHEVTETAFTQMSRKTLIIDAVKGS